MFTSTIKTAEHKLQLVPWTHYPRTFEHFIAKDAKKLYTEQCMHTFACGMTMIAAVVIVIQVKDNAQ